MRSDFLLHIGSFYIPFFVPLSWSLKVPNVQDDQPLRSVQTPSLILPRVRGEKCPAASKGRGVNDLNGLNGLNKLIYYRPFTFLSCASCSRKDKSNSSLTFNFNPARFLSLAITFSIALAVTNGSPGVTWL